MPLTIIRQDITKLACDAIVDSTNSRYRALGGADRAIHEAAGPELDRECAGLGPCPIGGARATKGYALPCRYVIHTAAPLWAAGRESQIASCYKSSLELAKSLGCETVAVPLIGARTLGVPHKTAISVAVGAITDFLAENDMLVYLVVFGTDEFRLSSALFGDIKSYIDDNYAERREPGRGNALRRRTATGCSVKLAEKAPECSAILAEKAPALPLTLELDESFSEMLLRKIDEKGMTDAECYKKANIDRKLFSKIRSDPQYRPKKTTAIAFAVALELSLPETEEMLKKAGFALSHSNKFDLIVEYFIKAGNYNVFEINEALFAFDQSLIGG